VLDLQVLGGAGGGIDGVFRRSLCYLNGVILGRFFLTAAFFMTLSAVCGVACADDVNVLAVDSISPEAGSESDPERLLRILKTGLLYGSDEQARVDSAIELLRRGDRESWDVLLQVLVSRDTGISAVRQAVCRAFVKSRGWIDTERSRKVFLNPLIELLINGEPADAKLVAEALLGFKYRDVSQRLLPLVQPGNPDKQIRLNAVYALKLWPDNKKAISELLTLLEDEDIDVALSAENALQEAFGIPAGTDREELKGIVRDWNRKSPIEFVRTLGVVQRAKMTELQEQIAEVKADRDHWLGLYLEALDREYKSAEAPLRGTMVAARLTSKLAAEKIWAIGRIAEQSAGSPEAFKANLFLLIKDEDATVRLNTAKVLSKMSVLDPAENLLAQFKVEKDEQVAIALLEALGEACSFAFSPNSTIKLSDDVRDQTLRFAGGYISADEADKAATGTKVVRKLLKINGVVNKELVQQYLQLILARYDIAAQAQAQLKGHLLNEMAKLCEKNSPCRAEATRLFKPAFVTSLAADDNDSLREAAVQGLVNIDKAAALAEFKERTLTEDSSLTIRKTVIVLAGAIGTVEDLDWLAAKIGVSGVAESAQQAIVEILKRQGSAVVADFSARLGEGTTNGEYVKNLLEMAEKKAEDENDTSVLLSVRLSLLDIYLISGNAVKTAAIVTKHLNESEYFTADDEVACRIEAYLNSQDVKITNKTELVTLLSDIKAGDTAGPMWTELLNTWRQKITPENPASVPKE